MEIRKENAVVKIPGINKFNQRVRFYRSLPTDAVTLTFGYKPHEGIALAKMLLDIPNDSLDAILFICPNDTESLFAFDILAIPYFLVTGNRLRLMTSFWNIFGWCIYGMGEK